MPLGFIRVFARTLNTLNGNDNWNKIVGFSGSTTGEGFGTDVAINSDGTIIAVGSPFRSGDNGRVSIFVKSGSTFSLSKTINGDSGSNFGISVDLNEEGNILVVGASGATVRDGNESGASYTYENLGGNTWNLIAITEGDGEEDRNGVSVAINSTGDVIASGASENTSIKTDTDINAGYAKVFDLYWCTDWSHRSAFSFSERNEQILSMFTSQDDYDVLTLDNIDLEVSGLYNKRKNFIVC